MAASHTQAVIVSAAFFRTLFRLRELGLDDLVVVILDVIRRIARHELGKQAPGSTLKGYEANDHFVLLSCEFLLFADGRVESNLPALIALLSDTSR